MASFKKVNLIDEIFLYTAPHDLDGASLKNPLDISEDWDVRETKILGHDILTNARMKEECLQEL